MSTSLNISLKQEISKYHIYTVYGYIRLTLMYIPTEIIDVILLFYAASIVINIQYQTQIKHILLSVDDDWICIQNKIFDIFGINESHFVNCAQLEYKHAYNLYNINIFNNKCIYAELAKNSEQIFNLLGDERSQAILIKVAIIGEINIGIGKTSLMVRYIEKNFDDEYIETMGLYVMEKSFELKSCRPKLQIYELGGKRALSDNSDLIGSALRCTKAVIFAFNLIEKTSLISIKRWYKNSRKLNKTFKAILVGTKYDLFKEKDDIYKSEITKIARSYAENMHAPFIMCSAKHDINIKQIFTVAAASVFLIKIKSKQKSDQKKQAILEYDIIYKKKSKKKKKKKKNKQKTGLKSGDSDNYLD